MNGQHTTGTDNRRPPQDGRRPPRRDQYILASERGQFEKEALEVTLEGRLAMMMALASRTREVCTGILGHPRVREMGSDDKVDLHNAVADASNLADSINNFIGILLSQDPTKDGRKQRARELSDAR